MERLKYIFEKNTQGCIPEVVKLLKLNGIITVSSASAERSFSCLGRVKSYLRSKMNDEKGSVCCAGYPFTRISFKRRRSKAAV